MDELMFADISQIAFGILSIPHFSASLERTFLNALLCKKANQETVSSNKLNFY